MKRNVIITLAVIGAFIIGAATLQPDDCCIKIGYIDSVELVSQLPGYTDAQNQLKKYSDQLETDGKAMLEDLQKQEDDYDKMKDMLTDAMKKAKEQDIVNLQAKIQQYQTDAQTDLNNKQQELLAPLLDKANKAINDVAKENAYRFVFDTQAGAIVYAQDEDNIMPLVQKKLGIAVTAPTTPNK